MLIPDAAARATTIPVSPSVPLSPLQPPSAPFSPSEAQVQALRLKDCSTNHLDKASQILVTKEERAGPGGGQNPGRW